jgi:hypothetical protein
MKTEERPEKIMAMMMEFLWAMGKLRARFALDQFSRKREQMRRMGMERRLL